MYRKTMRSALFTCLCFIAASIAPADRSSVSLRSRSGLAEPNTTEGAKTSAMCGRFPLTFEINEGQIDPDVQFLARAKGYSLFLTSTEMVLSMPGKQFLARRPGLLRWWALARPEEDEDPLSTLKNLLREDPQPETRFSHPRVVRVKMEGANPSPKMIGVEELPGKVNYLIGNDPKKWRTNIATYRKVRFDDVYPGIDLVYYGNQRQLEYDWIVTPGSDAAAIRFEIAGSEHVAIDTSGDLVVQAGDGDIILGRPLIYQERDGCRIEIAGEYDLLDKRLVGFSVGEYDGSLPLVIDPILIYSTFLGGNFSEAGHGIAVDSSGNAYVTGETISTTFPTANPFQANLGGGLDAFVTKLSASGNALIYTTYLGGNNKDVGRAIAVDSSGGAYVTGETSSTTFPTVSPFQANLGGGLDAFVTKLNASGNALVYSTYIGGDGSDYGRGIAVDSFGNAFITGETDSSNFSTANPFQANLGGGSDAFVTKVRSSGNALAYSTYLGGNSSDLGYDIAVDLSGNAYVTGRTDSSNFPTENPFQADLGGGFDAFVTRLNSSGNALAYSTFLGGYYGDMGAGIAVDSSGNAYVTGQTNSSDFPVANPFQANRNKGYDAFVAKLNASGNALVYSTYLGGEWGDAGHSIAVDSFGNAYVTGETTSTTFPTADPFQANFGGGVDAFVTKLNASGDALVYSTYLGGNSTETGYVTDIGYGIAVNPAGNAYVTGYTTSTTFPTEDPFQMNKIGNWDVFVTKLGLPAVSLDLAVPGGGASTTTTGGGGTSPQVGYAAATVTSGTVPFGVAVFSFRQNSVVVSEAAVPASAPTTSARIFVDHHSEAPTVPGNIGAGHSAVNTGLALVNRGSTTANVTYTLRNSIGAILTAGHGSVSAGAHFAKFIHQLKEVAPDFYLPAEFPTNIRFGSLDITSSQPLSVLALRLTINQRNEALLTSTPIGDLTKSPGNLPLYFPQFADGGGYITSIILLNTSNAVETGKLEFFNDSGTPLLVNQAGGTRDLRFAYSIEPGGLFVFQSDGSPSEANVGSVQLTPDASTMSPVGAGIFSFSQGGIQVTESGVPSASPTTHARIYIDQSGSHGTGLAIASPGELPVRATLKAFRTDGSTPVGTSAEVNLNGNGHAARFVSQLISGLPSGFTGVLDISSLSPFVALTLRSLTNSRGDFLLTTFPVADATRPAPEPIVFPQIADGGGYITEFIFLSPSGAASLTLSFFGEDGMPLAIGN